MVRVDVWRTSLARAPDEVARLEQLLDVEEKRRATMFRADRDRRRFIVARATLRTLLANHAGLDPRRITFVVSEGGKPVVSNDGVGASMHFNLSHCGELALCAIADREVGVDVEQLRHHHDIERVAQHFFSRKEVKTLEMLSGTDCIRFFFRTWVRKEAFVKATGEGLARSTASFTVMEPPETGVTLHSPDGSSRADNSYRVYDLPDIDDHFAAVALAAGGPPAEMRYREWPV
jgi:4'-phosphopantetheinyl transferase